MPKTPAPGFTLPVFAAAAAKAAILSLVSPTNTFSPVTLDLLGQDGIAEIAIAQLAKLDQNTALAITISDPGDNLDLTAGTPIWAWVKLEPWQGTQLILEAGMGLGQTVEGKPAIYAYAQKLLEANLVPLLENITATIRFILPQGKQLAERTSNQAFGILEGLALLGTRGISQPVSVEEKLEDFRADLRQKALVSDRLAFYIGANSFQVALKLGFRPEQIVQTANWVGVMLVEAALLEVKHLTLVGYHGKLLKLAGGIFNTSSHIADARSQILTAAAVHENLPMPLIQQILRSPTAEASQKLLATAGYEQIIFNYLANQIHQRSLTYIKKYAGKELALEIVLCDRLGEILVRI